MMKQKDIVWLPIIFGIIALVLFDQLTKIYFEGKAFYTDSLIYIFSIQNTGSAFGVFSSYEWYSLAVILLSFIILLVLVASRAWFVQTTLRTILFIFFVAGIIGNLLDRFFLGYVRDFIAVQYFSIFNVADIFLTLAVLLYLWIEISEDKDLKKEIAKGR